MGFIKKSVRHFSKIFSRKKTISIDGLRNSCSYDILGNPGPLISEVFSRISHIPGWFTFDDCTHFHLILSLQSVFGIEGDLFEIGSYHGRSTALMARYLKKNERIVICDAFDVDALHNYKNPPSPEMLIKNIRLVNPNLDLSKIIINRCLSSSLSLNPDQQFRFIHVDGGHFEEEVKADLVLCCKHIISNGVIVIDDYGHPDFPDVTKAVDECLRHQPDLKIIADLNRHGAFGRKLYLIKTGMLPKNCTS